MFPAAAGQGREQGQQVLKADVQLPEGWLQLQRILVCGSDSTHSVCYSSLQQLDL